jgi:predicted nucleic acid-binding Zn ribbon protein
MAKVLGRIGSAPSPETMELLFARWEEVVGAEFSDHLRPQRLEGSTLVVGVDHPVWATRARMESERILSRVRQLGDRSIERIEVVVLRP